MRKYLRVSLAVSLSLLSLVSMAAADLWETNFEKAKESAEKSNRYMLINFTGSDWCGWCIKLEEEVFSQDVFQQYADEQLVPVIIDFPRKTQLEDSLREQNETLVKQFGIQGFPTLVILSPSGERVAQTGYQRGGPEKYVEHLKSYINAHRQKNDIPPPHVASPVKQPARRSTRGVPTSVLRQWEQAEAKDQ